MLWFFERQTSRLRYEIRRAGDGDSYELIITHPDGREEIEVYADPGAVISRAEHLQRTLAADGWQSAGGQPPERRSARVTP